jgi:ABC-type phosphate transport system substrate-binding protein
MYNLIDTSGNQVTNLNLTRRVVCRMFTENEMFWNDPEIQSVNPGLALPAKPIGSVARADGSGTSFVLSQFCIDTAPDVWNAFRAIVSSSEGSVEFNNGQPTSNWPQIGKNRVFAQGADGVAAAVADSSGLYSVTYNEAGFAKVRGFPNASVQNAAQRFTQPTEDAVSTALSYASEVDNGAAGITFKLDFNGADPDAYFPSTYSYVIAQATGYPADKGEVLAKFLCYAVTKGQRKDLTDTLGYARLSAPLVDLARKAIARIPGAPAWDQCKVESAPPPAAQTTLPPTATTAPPAGGGGTATTVPSGGTLPPGAAPTTSIVIDPVTGNTTVITSPRVNSSSVVPGVTPTSIVTDPITGETVVVTIPTQNASGDCLDPVTGLPVDPSQCAAVQPGADAGGGGAGAPVVAAPAAQNPTIVPAESEIDTTEIAWWLAQGATVCAVGVALAGVRRRAS